MARVGLLEDNIRIAKMCATMLQFAGHAVDIYEQSQTCLDALLYPVSTNESSSGTYSSLYTHLPIELLILDLHLPEMPGIEVIRLLKAHNTTCDLPLIFCTASSPREITRALRLAPNSLVIEKPFRLDALVAAVDETLGLEKVTE